MVDPTAPFWWTVRFPRSPHDRKMTVRDDDQGERMTDYYLSDGEAGTQVIAALRPTLRVLVEEGGRAGHRRHVLGDQGASQRQPREMPMNKPSSPPETLGVRTDEAHRSHRAPDCRCARQPEIENDPDAPMGSAFHRDEIIAMIFHELRSPLAVMSNVLQACRVGASSLDLAKTQEVLDRQVNRALLLVDDLLDISRLGRAVPVMDEAVDLSRVVADAIEDLAHQFRARCQGLAVHLPTEAVFVRGHAIRLAQVVVNLLDNSSKYSPVGGQITLRLARDSDQAVLRIQDNGLGITAEDLPHVFELFFRSKHSLDQPQGGLGIGLALARQLAELHGGMIDARSDGHNRGSEFTLRLPATSARASVELMD